MDFALLQARLARLLSPPRYHHSLGVMRLSQELALEYGADLEAAGVAGLLHDITRETPPEDLLGRAKEFKIPIDEIEKRVPILLHGKVGAEILKREWRINNREVLEAVACHVTGAPEMTVLAQIVFIADFAEPGRDFLPARVARTLAYNDRIMALDYIIRQEIGYLLEHGLMVPVSTVAALNRLMLKGDLTPENEI